MTGEHGRIFKLLEYAITDGNVFLPNNETAIDLVKDCLELYNRDNVCVTLDNAKGALCSTYPINLIVPLKQCTGKTSKPIDNNNIAANEWVDLVIKGRFARTWGRFPVPVLVIGDKFICRSSTLARSPEMYTRMGFQYFMQGEPPLSADNGNQQNGASNGHIMESSVHFKNDEKQPLTVDIGNGLTKKQLKMQESIQPVNGTNQNKENKDWLVDKMRKTDIDLLHALKVNVICDLMVENKKVKFGINLTSSEKVDRQKRYSDFELISIPYPGCEFFADYTQNNHSGIGLQFDWQQAFVDAELQVPNNLTNMHNVKWNEYMKWDLVELTQNYLKLLLNCIIRPSSSGILLHCISGWDRTPLFISLLRLSLWADGLIHQSLDAEEVVFLTLAYDWLLFSHQFSDRIYKNQEIMLFCFKFLVDITSSEYSLLSLKHSLDSSFPNSDADDMFVFEHFNMPNSNDNRLEFSEKNLNGIKRKSEEDYGEFEELHHEHRNTNSAIHHNVVTNSDDVFIDLQEVKTCLNCLLSNIPEQADASSNCNHLCENDNLESSQTTLCNSTLQLKSESPVAVLPLTCNTSVESERPLAKNQSTLQSELIDDTGQLDTELVAPRCALSASYETAVRNIYLDHKQTVPTASSQNGMSNSYGCIEECSICPHNKSEPISVPISHWRTADCALASNSISSSLSTTAAAAEPGSSWQMISAPSPRDANFSENNLLTPGGTFSSSNNSITSHSSSSIGAIDSETLKVKLRKRKEKLQMAHNVMIPAYSAVVQRQRQQQESGGLSALMGTLVHFVKRS